MKALALLLGVSFGALLASSLASGEEEEKVPEEIVVRVEGVCKRTDVLGKNGAHCLLVEKETKSLFERSPYDIKEDAEGTAYVVFRI